MLFWEGLLSVDFEHIGYQRVHVVARSPSERPICFLDHSVRGQIVLPHGPLKNGVGAFMVISRLNCWSCENMLLVLINGSINVLLSLKIDACESFLLRIGFREVWIVYSLRLIREGSKVFIITCF